MRLLLITLDGLQRENNSTINSAILDLPYNSPPVES